jgi:hypothetical protein
MTPGAEALVRSTSYRGWLVAGTVAGCMDITAACLNAYLRARVSPTRVLQYVASGALGPDSFKGGAKTAALGLVFHFLIAFTAAGVFFFVTRHAPFLTSQPILAGVVYGMAVYTFMYWVVTPLSRVHRGSFSWIQTVIAILTHIVCVGLPISLSVRQYSK